MKILVAEDEVFSRRLLEKTLSQWGYQPICVEDGREALEILLTEDGPRLALLDWMIPGLHGIHVCQRVRSADYLPMRYIIILTARNTQEDTITALDHGADAFLIKPWNFAELRSRLNVGRRILETYRQMETTNRRLAADARLDPATNLITRRTAVSRFEDELARVRHHGLSLGVILAELDDMANMIARYGQSAEEELLRQLAETLQGQKRRYDLIARFGAHRFLILLPHQKSDNFPQATKRLARCFSEQVFERRGQATSISASISATLITPESSLTADKIIHLLEKGLLTARQEGSGHLWLQEHSRDQGSLLPL